MTGEELKRALLCGTPVEMDHPIYGKHKFRFVEAIRYTRSDRNTVRCSAEVRDYNDSSLAIVDPRYLKL